MVETMRLTLILLHILIAIFAAVNLHPHLTSIIEGPDPHLPSIIEERDHRKKKISTGVYYIFNIPRLLLYHAASISAVWFNRRHGAGMVRASGLLLIGELLEMITGVIKEMLDGSHLARGELPFIVVYFLLLLTALLMTFRLAEKLSKRQKSLLQVELLADTVHDMPIDNNVEAMII